MDSELVSLAYSKLSLYAALIGLFVALGLLTSCLSEIGGDANESVGSFEADILLA